MHVAMVSEHASPLAALGGVDAGGQNVHVAALSSALAAMGHQITVYTRRDTPDLPDRVEAVPGVEVVHITAGPVRNVSKDELLPFIPALGAGIAADWGTRRPDLVHGHFWMSGLAALDAVRLIGAQGKIPVLQTFHALGTVKRRHQGAADTSPTRRAHLEPWVGMSADGIIATCSDEVSELRNMGIASRSVSVVPCGVDSDLFRPDGARAPRGPRHRIGSVGRLVPRKGVDTVIKALALLKADGRTDIELLIVGGAAEGTNADPEAQRLLTIAQKFGVADQVIFRGQVPQAELAQILRSLDAVVCSPWYEPFGIVPLEAMACGVPVVAATVGGMIDTIVDGTTGLHVPPRDAAAVAQAIERLIDDPNLSAHLGAGGRDRVVKKYSWGRVAEMTHRVYRGALVATRARAMLGLDGDTFAQHQDPADELSVLTTEGGRL